MACFVNSYCLLLLLRLLLLCRPALVLFSSRSVCRIEKPVRHAEMVSDTLWLAHKHLLWKHDYTTPAYENNSRRFGHRYLCFRRCTRISRPMAEHQKQRQHTHNSGWKRKRKFLLGICIARCVCNGVCALCRDRARTPARWLRVHVITSAPGKISVSIFITVPAEQSKDADSKRDTLNKEINGEQKKKTKDATNEWMISGWNKSKKNGTTRHIHQVTWNFSIGAFFTRRKKKQTFSLTFSQFNLSDFIELFMWRTRQKPPQTLTLTHNHRLPHIHTHCVSTCLPTLMPNLTGRSSHKNCQEVYFRYTNHLFI